MPDIYAVKVIENGQEVLYNLSDNVARNGHFIGDVYANANNDYTGGSKLPDEARVNALIASAIGGITGLDIVIVDTLPQVGATNTIYFILTKQGNTGDIYDEYMYINSTWELIGTTQVDLSSKADKADTVLDTTLSRGRASNRTVGTGSFAFGSQVEASGAYSHAEGNATTALGAHAHAEGFMAKALGANAHAEGYDTTANGEGAHVEGSATSASGKFAHAEGANTTASGNDAHAEGLGSQASGLVSHAEGGYTKATNNYAHAEGYYTEATKQDSHAEGYYSKATGNYAHAEGDTAIASGVASHAEGSQSNASGDVSHAEGTGTIANHKAQHVFGEYNTADPAVGTGATHGDFVELVGNGTADNARSNARALDWSGNEYLAGDVYVNCGSGSTGGTKLPDETRVNQLIASAIGGISGLNIVVVQTLPQVGSSDTIYFVLKSGSANNDIYDEYMYINSSWELIGTREIDLSSKADKADTVLTTTLSRGRKVNTTVGTGSFAFGTDAEASGSYSYAQGYETAASANYAHAEGYRTTASGVRSHAEGDRTTASGEYAHAEGAASQAQGITSHAEGGGTVASGVESHAEGGHTTASGKNSHAEGAYTVANHFSQHVFGQYNIPDPSQESANNKGTYVEIVGNGENANNTSNARTLDWDGNEELAGDLTVNKGSANECSVSDLLQDLEDLKSDFYYKEVTISTFTASVTQAEMGSTVDAVNLSFTINKVPETLSIDGNAITPAQTGTESLTNLGLTSNKTWTMTATDAGSASHAPATSIKTVTLSFLNRCFYGASASGTVDGLFVTGLANKILTGTRARTITVNAASGEYIWYCVPTRLGACSFKVGGFDGGFEAAQTISVTNASGYTENYYVYRSTNSGLGNTTIVVS